MRKYLLVVALVNEPLEHHGRISPAERRNCTFFRQLTTLELMLITIYMTRKRIYSTAEVARMVGVHKITLLRWLLAGRLSEPRRTSFGGQDLRLWSAEDVRRVKAFKAANYRIAIVKGRGRKAPERASAGRYRKTA